MRHNPEQHNAEGHNPEWDIILNANTARIRDKKNSINTVLRSRCLDVVATTNIVKMQNPTT